MKQFILCCLGLIQCFVLHAQHLEAIRQDYTNYNKKQVEEKVYVQTDRTFYKPGDNIWFNVFVTNAENSPSARSEALYAELYNPKGALLHKLTLKNENGYGKGHFKLTTNDLGGVYTLRVYSYWMQNFDKSHYFEKKLTVQNISAPKLLMKLDFEREAYGAGDQVMATFEARTKDNLPLANKTLSYTVQLGGKLLVVKKATTNDNGLALISYELPKKLLTNDNLVNIQIENDGLIESIARSAPIVLHNLDLQILPEGGNMIANQINRIAIKVLNEFGQPADIEAEVVDRQGKVISHFETFHQGMGAFELTPQKGEQYQLRVIKPTGINQRWNLPKVDKHKLGIYVKKQERDQLSIDIYNPVEQSVIILAQQHGKLIYTKEFQAKKGANSLRIPTQDLPIGILQLTVLDTLRQVHAERLVFVNKHRKLNIDIRTNKEKYTPREKVKMDIIVQDESGKGVAGCFSMAIVDDKQHSFADDKQDNILSYLLMSSGLKGDIYEPSFYFDPKEEKADEALDYVLLTHGWRRFDWQEILAGNILPINYKVNAQEIAGYLKIGDQLAKNQTIFLAEGQARYTKKKALATVQTDDNGFFKFENIAVKFPAYLCANYHGEYHAVPIYQYSKSGIKSNRINHYVDKYETTYFAAYQAKNKNNSLEGVCMDKSNMGTALGAATILLKQNEKVVASTLSNSDGSFSVPALKAGFYTVEVIFIGKQQLVIPKVEITNKATLFLEVYMANEYGMLDDQLLAYELDTKIKQKKEIARPIVMDSNRNRVEIVYEDGEKLVLEDYKSTRKSASLSDLEGEVLLDANFPIQPNGMTDEDYIEHLKDLAERGDLRLSNEREVQGRKQLSANEIRVQAGIESTNHYTISNRYNVNSKVEQFKIASLYLEQIEPQKVDYAIVQQFYEPNYSQQQTPTRRSDFRKTIYWNPNIVTNEKGKASVVYYNSDEITTFRAILEGNTAQGELGHKEHTYAVDLPFSITTKLPTVLSFGDTIRIPVVLKNNSSKELTGDFKVENPAWLTQLKTYPSQVTIPVDSHRVLYLEYQVAFEKGEGVFAVGFEALQLSDWVETSVYTISKGFPVNFAIAGQELEQTDTFIIQDAYKGSMESELSIYPNILDGLIDGVESILNSPSGCFEQVSSSNYPNILALDLMEQMGDLKAGVRQKALNYLKDGYAKLTAYEIKNGGFEWYGRAPAHEGLTAYGLVQFHDMQAVYDQVDPAMVERTKTYLLSRRDGKGGFEQNVGKYGFSGNKTALFNAYITWALSEVGTFDLYKEIEAMTEEAIESEDLYRMSLAALTHFNVGDQERGEDLLATIQTMIRKVGIEQVKAESTVTYSYGNALNLETLSFAALAMMRSNQRNENLLVRIIKHLLSKRQNGRFGSTQSTVMVLKTLSTYAKSVGKGREDGNLVVLVNNKVVKNVAYKKSDPVKIKIKDLHHSFVEGQNIVTLKYEGTTKALPYSLDVNWTARTPQSHVACPLVLHCQLNNDKAHIGETIRLELSLENKWDKNLPSTMAIVGIPAGLSLQPWQLKNLQEKEAFAFYELKDNYLILYYRGMEAKEQKKLSLDLKTEVPGSYTAPANSAYLYYGDEHKYWSKGAAIQVDIQPF
ncbi:MG2 domain-containing protein [Aureispira anguillae]|uniref:MG2 domain-containing protein n=1 Tax=Aureispira anguillae TaxID=2864201 RepID=A0A915YK16_9BACT|nr:MG2 domain-containing protein [Aureispira anguillae]BDS14392.1 MG2 domain-containing protein [Aureispira anguillae]